jgi:hypothetical protein
LKAQLLQVRSFFIVLFALLYTGSLNLFHQPADFLERSILPVP